MFLFDPHPAHSATRGLAHAQKARWEPLAVIATLLIRRIPKRTLYSGCADEGSIRHRHRGRNVARGGPVLPRWRVFGGVELEPGPAGLCASSNPTLAVQSTWAGTSRHHAREKSEPTFQRPYQDELRTTIDVDRGYRQIAMVARFHAVPAAEKLTGRAFNPRRTKFSCHSTSAVGRRRSGKVAKSAGIAIWASSRASGAPRQ